MNCGSGSWNVWLMEYVLMLTYDGSGGMSARATLL